MKGRVTRRSHNSGAPDQVGSATPMSTRSARSQLRRVTGVGEYKMPGTPPGCPAPPGPRRVLPAPAARTPRQLNTDLGRITGPLRDASRLSGVERLPPTTAECGQSVVDRRLSLPLGAHAHGPRLCCGGVGSERTGVHPLAPVSTRPGRRAGGKYSCTKMPCRGRAVVGAGQRRSWRR